MDEIRAYSKTLSPDEVQQLYNYAPGPVLHLKMDEKSGTTAFDSSGNDNHGTLVNGPIWENGRINGGLGFYNTDSAVNVSNVTLSNLSQVTISAWARKETFINNTSGVWGFTSNAEDWSNLQALRLVDENLISVYTGTSEADDVYNSFNISGSGVMFGEWIYFTTVTDYLTGKVLLYVNGVKKGESINTYNSTSIENKTHSNALVGKFRGVSGWDLDGDIDDFKIYNYARTQEQILEDMGASAEASASQGALQKPILDLNFDEGQGPIAYDASGNNNHGTLVSGTTGTNTTPTMMWDKGGKKGGAMEFDGTDDIINMGILDIKSWSSISTSLWFNASSLPGYRRMLSMRYSAADDIRIYHNVDDSTLRVEFDDGTVSGVSYPFNDINNWHHVVSTYDGKTIRMYLDGEEVGSPATDIFNFSGMSGDTFIGGQYGVQNIFNGLIDEVKIYNYALSEDEIKTLYNDSSAMVMGDDESRDNNGTEVTGANKDYCIPGDTAKCDKPVLELKMDEMTGTIAKDTSGNGNNGTLYNSPNWINGKNSGAVEFNGINSGITRLGFYAPTEGTFSAWVKSDFNEATESSDHYIVSDGLGGVPNFRIRYQTGTYRYILYSGGLGLTLPAETSDIEGWWHVTAIWDSTGMSIYKDGKLWGSYVGNSQNSSGEGIVIGAASSNYATLTNLINSWDGQIDEVRIYNYARTPAQIAWDYNRGKPIGHWKMDEASGTQVDDWSGNANHGTMTNMDPIGDRVEGKNNKALDFDGVDDYVNIDSIVNSFNNKKGSFSAWVKRDFLDTVSADKYLFHAYYNNGNFHTIRYLEGTDQWEFAIDRAYTLSTVSLGASMIPQNVWTHVLMTWDEDGDDVKVYINGENKGSNSAGGSYVAVPTIGRIGTDRTNLFMFDGLIDDVKIFNYELTGEQVKLDYNNGAVNFR
jgi:hypothetical protein